MQGRSAGHGGRVLDRCVAERGITHPGHRPGQRVEGPEPEWVFREAGELRFELPVQIDGITTIDSTCCDTSLDLGDSQFDVVGHVVVDVVGHVDIGFGRRRLVGHSTSFDEGSGDRTVVPDAD